MSPTTRTSTADTLPKEHLIRLIRASHAFNSTIEIEALLPRVLDMILQTVEAEAGSLWMLEEEGDALVCRIARGTASESVTGLELPFGAGFVGDVVANRRSALSNEPHADPRYLPQIDELTGLETRTILAVPLITRGECIGGIEVINDTSGKGVFDESDRIFLEALADDAAAAIRNASLFEAEKRARDLAALLEVSHQITSTFDLDRVLVSIVNLAGRALRFDRCVLALREDESLRVRAISGEMAVDRKSSAVRAAERFLLWAAERGEALALRDVEDPEDETAAQVRERFGDYLETTALSGLLCLPIRDAEGELGMLLFEFADAEFPEEWGREAAELLANEAALAIRNARLYADVPFISWLEPLAEKRRSLAAVPGSTWLRWGAVALAVLLALTVIRLPLRLAGTRAAVRAAVEQPARAGIGGILDQVNVREGQRVEAGEPIGRIRNEELLLRLREARAELDVARREAAAADARGDAAAAVLAGIRVAQHTDELRLLERERERGRITAPVSGVVLTPRVERLVGGHFEPGAAVVDIGEPDWAELELEMRQAELGEIRRGDRVRAKVSAHPDVVFEGRVVEIAPRAAAHAASDGDEPPTYTVRAVLDNRQRLLRPGMGARAKVITEPRPLLVHIVRRPLRWLRMHLWR